MWAAVSVFALLPGIGAVDPRVGVDVAALPWAAVGRLQVPGVARCTGVVVAPHWAVTAAHCLGVPVLGHAAPPSAIHLLLGYRDGRFDRHVQPDAVIADPAAAADPGGHRGSDLALLHVAEEIGPVLPLQAADVPPGTAVQLGGYGQDRAERLAVDPACRVTGTLVDARGGRLLRHDCNGTRGTSGGAVVAYLGGAWHLVGMAEAAQRGGAGGVAVPAGSIARRLAGLLAGLPR